MRWIAAAEALAESLSRRAYFRSLCRLNPLDGALFCC